MPWRRYSAIQSGCRQASILVLSVSFSGRTKPLRMLRSRLELIGHVERDGERGEAGIAGAAHHVLGDAAVLGEVELVPAVIRGDAAEVLDQAGAGAGHDEGHVGGLGRLGQHHVAAAPEQPDEAGGRDADRARVGLAEQGGALVARGHVDAVARHQPVLAEGVVVAGDSDLVLQAALDEIVGDLGQPALGQPAQVVEVDGGVNAGGQGGAPPNRARFREF